MEDNFVIDLVSTFLVKYLLKNLVFKKIFSDKKHNHIFLEEISAVDVFLLLSYATAGLQELKTFVDLAYISTGDQGLEIAKVRCLQSAAIGYAPLIFNLETYCSYKDFLERCEEVWKALDSNQNLPSELVSNFILQKYI